MQKNIVYSESVSCEYKEQDNLFDNLKAKLVYITGLLHLKQSGESYTSEQKLSLEQLGLKLSANIDEFNQSERDFRNVETTLSTLKAIEKEIKSIRVIK
jgi:hypothetical protein